MRLPLTRLRSSYLVIAAAIALVVVAVAFTFRTTTPERSSEQRTVETTKDRAAVSAMPKALGRRHCERECAAVRKGYIYRAEQELQGVRGPYLEPEVCTCF